MEIYIPPFLLCVTSTIYDFLCCYLCKIVRHCLLIRGTKIYFALNKDRNFSAIKHLNGVHIRFDDRKYCFISVNLSCRVVLYCFVLSFTLSLPHIHIYQNAQHFATSRKYSSVQELLLLLNRHFHCFTCLQQLKLLGTNNKNRKFRDVHLFLLDDFLFLFSNAIELFLVYCRVRAEHTHIHNIIKSDSFEIHIRRVSRILNIRYKCMSV